MTINERFFYLLDKSGISQKKIATDIGISEKTISAWRSRKSDPPANIITTIAEYFDTSVQFLLTSQDTSSIIDTEDTSNNTLAVDERMLLDTYREMTDNGKTQLLNTMKEIWADNRPPANVSDPNSKLYKSHLNQNAG